MSTEGGVMTIIALIMVSAFISTGLDGVKEKSTVIIVKDGTQVIAQFKEQDSGNCNTLKNKLQENAGDGQYFMCIPVKR